MSLTSRLVSAPRTAGALVRACHPEPAAAVTVVSAALAAASGRDLPGILAVTAAVLTGQLSVGWSNDAIDNDRDRRSHRPGKPAATGDLGLRALWIAAVTAFLVCLPLSLLSGRLAGSLHLIAVCSAWLYNKPLKSTPLSLLPYLMSFGLLPVFVVLGLPEAGFPPAWLIVAGAGLGGGAHFANALPDLDDDTATGTRGLPHRIGRMRSILAADAFLLSASFVLAIGPTGEIGVFGYLALGLAFAALAVGTWWGRRPGSRAPFRAVLVLAVIDATLLLLAGPRLS